MPEAKPARTTINWRHVMTMVVLCGCGGTIFNVAYVFELYFLPLSDATGFSKSQMGALMSVFGLSSMIFYAPGGWLADRFSSRKLVTAGMLTTGAAGFYWATFPGFAMAVVLHFLWGMSIGLLFWNAMIRATRNWAASDQQGRAFGFLESGRGLLGIIPSTIMLGVFTWWGNERLGVMMIIIGWSSLIMLWGVAAWFVLEDDAPDPVERERKKKAGYHEVVAVLKLPAVWLIAFVIGAANTAFWATYSFTPYATEVYGLSVAVGAMIAAGRNWMNPIAPFLAGFVADRLGISNSVTGFMFILAISFGLIAFLPATAELLPLVLVILAVTALSIYALRGIYFALLDEQGIPKAVTGTAAGVASLIGFLPDVYMPALSGLVLDNNPGITGYRIMWSLATAAAVVGLMSALLLVKNHRKHAAAGA